MSWVKAFVTIVRWDVAVELRRWGEATLNMSLFAVLMLFIGSWAVSSPGRPVVEGEAGSIELAGAFGPIFFWMTILFAGTVGLARAFLVERENAALAGVLVAPVDPGLLYLAKVAATWLYVMIMELLVLATYIVLFDFRRWGSVVELLGVMASFTLAYVAAGVVIAAMTTGLRGGELVLRVLVIPVMVPSIILVLIAAEAIFWPEQKRSEAWPPGVCAVALLSFAAVYLASGFLLFPKVVEE